MNRIQTVQASSYGPEVASLLDSGKGRVLAVLSNALYLERSTGYVAAIVGDDAVDGPLSLRVLSIAPLLDTLRNTQDRTFRAVGHVIEIGQLSTISTAQALPWVPDLPKRLGTPAARVEAVQTLAHAIAAHSDRDKPGLYQSPSLARLFTLCHSERSEESKELTLVPSPYLRCFVSLRMTQTNVESEPQLRAPTDLILARMARGTVGFVDALRSGGITTACSMLTLLIGLGPGLTPSGDDLVSGVAAVMAWQSRLGGISEETTREIAASIRDAASRTNLISARLLHHACEGILYAPAMDLGAALLAGDPHGVPAPLSRLSTIGNTTGLDVATGLLVGCLATLPAA